LKHAWIVLIVPVDYVDATASQKSERGFLDPEGESIVSAAEAALMVNSSC